MSEILPRSFDEAMRFADTAVKAGLYGVKSKEDAFLRMVKGGELGLQPTQSLGAVHVIEGKPTLSANAMLAVCQRSPMCERFHCEESTAAKATYVAKRTGEPEVRLSWTIEQANQAGLTGKDNWKKYPADMLRARCISALARMVFADVLLGMYTPDEVTDGDVMVTDDGEIIDLRPALPAAAVVQRDLQLEATALLARIKPDLGDAERKAVLAAIMQSDLPSDLLDPIKAAFKAHYDKKRSP